MWLRDEESDEVASRRGHHCEGCIVSRLPPPGFELQISRLPEKVVIPLDRPGPPCY